jgi:exopolyphosphatase/guanosine-5'-triphosphate,3'-diphosphate pyrophosphatase
MRVAAVDCGTNSVRLLVCDLSAGTKRDLHRDMRIVRLGQDVDRTGRLDPAALERTRAALADYAEVCRQLGVERIRMVATSATRDASNRSDFVAIARQALGVEPEVVTGDEEAALSFAGATAGLEATDGPFLVMDIGGGSTEFVLGGPTVEAALSVDVGCVRLTERHLVSDPPTAVEVEAARADVDAALTEVLAAVPVAKARTAIGLAGTVTTVAALALGLSSYDPERIHLARLSAEQVQQTAAGLLGMSRAERAALPPMHPGRVDVIGAGALVLAMAVARLGLEELVVSEADILDGIAMSMRGSG